jgi:hypothetical protein
VTTTKIKTAGRVGAAAVALGLSLAGPQVVGVASADSPDTDSASASASPNPRPARGAAAPRSASQRAERVPESAATANPVSRGFRSAAVASPTGREAVAAIAVGPINDDPAPAAAPEANVAAIPASPANTTSRRQSRQPAPLTPLAPVSPRPSAVTGPTGSAAAPTVITLAAAVAAATLPASVASLPEPPAATATPSGVLWDINTAVVGVLDATQNWLSSLPANPVSELLEGALLLVRRNLFSQPATVVPVQTITTATGQIRGTLGAISPQGSPLSYTLTSDPLLGTVEVSPDGTYVYTPGTDFSEYDSFSVAVDSPGFNILNPSGSWRPAQASVSVWGSPGDGGPPDGALAKSLITRTFEIINLTSSNQMLTSWTAQANRTVVNVPPVGTIMQPGESKTIVLTQYAFQDLVGTAGFSPVDASGALIPGSSGSFSVTVATKPFGSVWRCDVGNCDNGTLRTVVLFDRPGTVIAVPSGQSQKQADVLNSFCSNGRATCSFTSRSFDNAAWAAPVQSSDSVRNNTTSNLTTTITVTNSQSTSTSLKLSTSVKAKVFEVVEVSVTAEASQTWTSTYTFSQAITVTAKPGEEVYIESSAPVKAVTGDFTVSFGNTTFDLYDVTFDSPDTDRRLRYDAIAVPIPPRV